jgi:glucose-6-phosphate 1-epimerase
MDIAQLEENYGIPGHLSFDTRDGLTRVQVQLASASATVYLHGAHLTHWQPAGQKPVIFLSDFAAGKAIRGGVPICFPWFAGRSDGQAGPSHGFARIQEWDLAFAAMIPGADGDRVHLTFTLGPSELSRSLGFDHFRVAYEVIVGAKLTMRLTVANLGSESMKIEEALHSYFAVKDVRATRLKGLDSAIYLDKADALKQKVAPPKWMVLTSETDRVFPANKATVQVEDVGNNRVITVEKTGSATTVVWNPWSELAAKLADMPDDAWPGFVCVETANTAPDAITLMAGPTPCSAWCRSPRVSWLKGARRLWRSRNRQGPSTP